MVYGSLWWFVVVQYMPIKLKNKCCLFDASAPTGLMVCGGLILLFHLVSNLIKLNAASSDEFKNQLKI